MSATLEAREPVARYLATPPLLQHFDRVAQAPGGVARLRELILTLAVQGKLVPQNATDEPASVLLERIRTEKAQLVREGKIRKEKPLAAIAEEEKPFALPPRWEWARIGEVLLQVTDGTHHTPKYLDSGVAFISVKDIDGKSVSFADCKFISETEHQQINARCNPERGDILLCRIGTLGRPTIVDTDRPFSLFVSVGLLKLPKFVDVSKYLHLLLSSPVMAAQYNEIKAGGSHTNKLNLGDIPQLRVPTPPLAEQSRIVARVEELMALCDTLEEAGRLAAVQHERLAGALFDALANSATAEEAAANWQRIAPHFDLLLDRTSTVDRLEQTILQLAVRGRLVPQNPADEPASALLQEIRSEKDCLIATGQLKRDKPLPPIGDEERPFDLPQGWSFVSFPELCVIGGGATPSKAKPMYWEGDLPWVSPKDMKVDLIADAQDHVSKLALEETRLPLVPRNSLLIVVRGMILAHSFPVGVTQIEVTINQDMKSLTPLTPTLTPYLALACKGFKQDILELVERSSHGTCKLESDKLFAFRFGLPPLPEQSRIVARVAELRDLCAQLRQRIATTAQIQSRLAETLVDGLG